MDLGHSSVKIVVDNGVVKLRTDADFKLGFVHTGLDVLHAVGTALDETLAQHFHTGRLDKDADGTVAVHLLDIDSAQHIQVEHHVHTHAGDAFHLALGRAVVTALIDFLVLDKFVVGNHLLELHAPEEEMDYEVNDLKAECKDDMNSFLIMLTASYYLIALRKKRPEVIEIVGVLLRYITDHDYYRPMLEEIGDKGDANWMLGKKIDLLNYEIQTIVEDHSADSKKKVREMFDLWLEGASVKSGDAMAQDVLSICYVNMMCDFAFNDVQRKAFEKLGCKTDCSTTDYILGNKYSLQAGAQLKDISLGNGMNLEDIKKLLTKD